MSSEASLFEGQNDVKKNITDEVSLDEKVIEAIK